MKRTILGTGLGLLVGVVAGICLANAPARQAPYDPSTPSAELLGRVTTVMDADDPLAAQLKADDVRHNRKAR